ncbi:hypothetical protein KCP74_01990 [Salmonella enterica subsp. enterica]|nr:hypothetical protein KCP74_01990 [Salmonella enterica subsp. enterica]
MQNSSTKLATDTWRISKSRGELEGKPGQTLFAAPCSQRSFRRIALLIGCGKERELDERQV